MPIFTHTLTPRIPGFLAEITIRIFQYFPDLDSYHNCRLKLHEVVIFGLLMGQCVVRSCSKGYLISYTVVLVLTYFIGWGTTFPEIRLFQMVHL